MNTGHFLTQSGLQRNLWPILVATINLQLIHSLTFMGPRIAKVFSSITNNMQHYTIYLFLWNALHVSGGSSAHHQEPKTVYTASGTKYPMLYIQFWDPGDGRRKCLKYVEHFTEINKLCNVASCWLYLKISYSSSSYPPPVLLHHLTVVLIQDVCCLMWFIPVSFFLTCLWVIWCTPLHVPLHSP